MNTWKPSLGAWFVNNGVQFQVWAPNAETIDLMLQPQEASPHFMAMQKSEDGYFTLVVAGIKAGTQYRYRIDRDRCLPDPASRYQPEGVHGPSQVIDPSLFSWSDSSWTGADLKDLVLYELHVGTFSPEGTFAGVRHKLEYLKNLGVTAVELMPVADFPGNRNWGYDGVDLFAPARCYGSPDDLRQLVDAAHSTGLAVFLDVVYNHLGPEGAYLGAFSPYYFSPKHKSPWGDAVNLDDHHCLHARKFFIENALHWIHEYHIDGLRLDATHAMVDDSPTHFLKELAEKVRASLPKNRKVLLIAEDDRNKAQLVQSASAGGYELDGVWADDFHHQVRVLLAGDSDGYFQDFNGANEDLAKTINQGWFYTGQHSRFRDNPRGTPTKGIPLEKFVHCIQNHDQIGNRAMGDRLNFSIDPRSYRAASALLVLSPSTPLIFMGQEWGANSPFCYFTDHPEELGKLVTEGRRNEFRHFNAFSAPEAREQIPDPQALSTFEKSRLNWDEREAEPHAGMFRLYQSLLHLRQKEFTRREFSFTVEPVGRNSLMLRYKKSNRNTFSMVACLKGKERIVVDPHSCNQTRKGEKWQVYLTTEDPLFTSNPEPPEISGREDLILDFKGPCAALLCSVLPD